MDIGTFLRQLASAVILVILGYGVLAAFSVMSSIVGVILTLLVSIAGAFALVRISTNKRNQNYREY